MYKILKIGLVLILLINLILVFIIFKAKKQTNLPNYSERIDSLELKLSNIKIKRDSIEKRIDTTIIKINHNEKIYKETISTIINNSTNDDYIFFINYLKQNRERHDSINNLISTERN